uniref:Myosin motor domain-containing protein n=1 Tax=Phytophthora ramorum TaxID=164328 RepID=H3HB93_PHYRM
MDVGARVWVAEPADERVWLAARVLEARAAAQRRDDPTSRFRRASHDEPDEDDAQAKRKVVVLVFAPSGECSNVLPRNMPREQDQRDLVALPHLHEASILNALRLRYERHAIYTHIGEILISINPFQNLPQLYGDQVLQRYAYDHIAQYGDQVTTTDPREPHLFAVARAAYMDIVQNSRSQSILISGESGAGKTEATKIIMTYFATEQSPPASPSRTTIEEQVLQSNPILEAFGNARTVRNDNSSRFGKFIELRFRDQRRRLAGARIRTYLLEKIRVIKQAPHERNFHIFYELLSADTKCVSKEQRQSLALGGGPQSFRLLNQSLCSKRRDGVKDAVQFRATRRAMQQLGMNECEIGGVLEIVAAVLHMGNVDFEQVPHKREDSVFADEARVATSTTGPCNHFTKAAELLGVSTEALGHALTKRWLHASNETLVVGVDVAHARNTRNALTMECYRLLFEWLVARVNNKLQRQASAPWDDDENDDDEEDATDFIGLLDIFGFEDMAENSFEQLCINYANEALQHQFNQYIFEEEQRLYRDEGIRWSFVDFPNNRACLELFEHRPIGIFSLTDQECVFPQGTDRALVAKYYLEFEKKTQHPHFRSAPVIQRATKFVVAHYAGCITYTIDGFLAKNKDSFCESAAQLLAGSSNPLIQALAAGSANEDAHNELDGCAVSVGTQFKIQLNELLTTVRATTPRYVRCIKPNDSHVGSLFESTRVVEQLRSGGVLEAVRVARAGFPVRLSHKQFLGRYRRVLLSLCKLTDEGFEKKHRSWSELDLCLHQLTQVLLSDDKHDEEVEGNEEDDDDEQTLQMRCGATIAVQARVRGCRAFRYVCWMRAMQQARVLQTRMRQLCARSKFLRARAGVLAVQCRFRCRRATRTVQALREARAVTYIATTWRRSSAQQKYRKLCRATLALQCAMRARVARRALKALREESRNVTRLKEDNAQLKDALAELRRQMQDMETQMAQSTTKERQQSSFPSFKAESPAHKSPHKSVMFSSDKVPAEETSNQRDCENQLELELSDDIVTIDGGNPNDANGRDPKLQTPNSRRTRRYSLPPTLAPANEDAELEDATPPASPRASRSRDRRHSLDLWRLQEVQAQEEVQQLREEIREAAADEPSPERQQQQEVALQKLIASQIKRKTMQLQLQLPEFELKVDNNCVDAGPASCIGHRRRSRTVDSPLPIPAPLTSCGRQGRSASAGMYRSRSSSNSSSCYMPPSVAVRPGVVVPRFAKAPTCYECDCTFNILVRRHHCRQCGSSFCFEHSTRQLALPHLGYTAAQRVCDTCFEAHIQAMTSLKLPSLMRHPTDELSTSSFASSPRGLESNDSYCGLDSPAAAAARVAPLRT